VLAPADLVPPPTRRQRVVWYSGTALVAAVLIVFGMRLVPLGFLGLPGHVRLDVPFYYGGDSLLILPLVKATVERGGHWRNERLGAPGERGQELHDFPVIDHLHFAVLWLLGVVIRDVVVLYNVYYLLTYPLCALAAMAAFRELRLTLPAAAVGGLLYAFLPYHHIRQEHHYFLSAYWLVPLSFLPALWLVGGDLPFFRRGDDGRYRFRPFTRGGLGLVLLGAATASAGAYYAFFACALYGAAGVYGWVAFRTWWAAAAGALLAAVVLAFGVVNHLPTFLYQREYGKNPVAARLPEESDLYGTTVAHLVLPISDHNLLPFNQVRARFSTNLRKQITHENEENTAAALGVFGAAGLVGLLAYLLVPVRKGWPYGPLSALAGFMVLFALTGGFAGVFNVLVFDQIRAWGRISVYLAFVCLFAVLWPLDRFLVTRTGFARRLRYPVWAAVIALGFFDQTPFSWFRDGVVTFADQEAARFQADKQFFEKIEEAYPDGGAVFTLPYIPFPENMPLHEMDTYEPARGYVHTRGLKWSYGAMKNREADAWQREVANAAPEEMLQRVVYRGFDGLVIDLRGYAAGRERNDGLVRMHKVKEAARQVGAAVPQIAHEDGKQFFLDLRPYRERLRAIHGQKWFDEEVRREKERVVVLWLEGFHGKEPYEVVQGTRWATGTATAVFVNPSAKDKEVVLHMAFGVDAKGTFEVTIDGGGLPQHDRDPGTFVPGGFADGFTLEKTADPPRDLLRRSYQLRVPPGRHAVVFRCRPPPTFLPVDHWPLYYYIHGFVMKQDP
jgi:hypothetical protein